MSEKPDKKPLRWNATEAERKGIGRTSARCLECGVWIIIYSGDRRLCEECKESES